MNEKLNAITKMTNDCQENAKNASFDATSAVEGVSCDGVTPSQHREITAVWKECAEMLETLIAKIAYPARLFCGSNTVFFVFAAVLFIPASLTFAHDQHRPNFPNALIDAAENGDVETVNHMLAVHRTGINSPWAFVRGLLGAVRQGHTEIVHIYINSGADVNAIQTSCPADYGWSPLLVASQAGRVEIARLLLDNGADINQERGQNVGCREMATVIGVTPLYVANDTDMVRVLLSRGANANTKTEHGYSPYTRAVQGLAYERAALLTKTPSHLICDAMWFHGSARNGARALAPIIPGFVNVGGNVNGICEFDGFDGSPSARNRTLHLAAKYGYSDFMDVLLINGAQVNLHNANGKTPFDLAKEEGNNAVALKLQQSGGLSGKDVVGEANQSLLAQFQAELVSLRMEVESLKAEVARICGETPDCAEASTQRAQLASVENQIGRTTSEITMLFPGNESGGGGSGGGGGGGSGLALGLGAAALLGIAVYALSPAGDAEAFSLRPLASYEYRDGAEALRYGMRLDYRRDSWGLWWSADDSSLGWGGEWRNDQLRAHAEVWDVGGAQDVSAGLGAEWKLAGWSVHPSWRMRGSADSESIWTWNSGVDLTAEWSGHGWMVRPSVRALDVENPADALFRLRIVREL